MRKEFLILGSLVVFAALFIGIVSAANDGPVSGSCSGSGCSIPTATSAQATLDGYLSVTIYNVPVAFTKLVAGQTSYADANPVQVSIGAESNLNAVIGVQGTDFIGLSNPTENKISISNLKWTTVLNLPLSDSGWKSYTNANTVVYSNAAPGSVNNIFNVLAVPSATSSDTYNAKLIITATAL